MPPNSTTLSAPSGVVVGIGSDIQASILTTSLLKRMGVRSIWAKAISEQHGLILEQLGIELDAEIAALEERWFVLTELLG